MGDVLDRFEAEMAATRDAATRRFQRAVAAMKTVDARLAAIEGACWDSSLVDDYKVAEVEFEDARDQVAAWERFPPTR
jgi:hypothetical protein